MNLKIKLSIKIDKVCEHQIARHSAAIEQENKLIALANTSEENDSGKTETEKEG